MTSNIVPGINKSYKGKSIRIREDKYVCLTDMATASGKRLNNWTRLGGTSEFLQGLSEATQIGVAILLEVENGTTTWAHPEYAKVYSFECYSGSGICHSWHPVAEAKFSRLIAYACAIRWDVQQGEDLEKQFPDLYK